MAKTPAKPATAAAKPAKAAAPKAAPKAAAPKATAPAKAAKAPPAPKAAKAPSGKPNALQTPLKPSADLAAVVGAGPLARGQVVSKVWEYIRKHNLQDTADKRQINADGALKKVFGGLDKVSMFEMNKHISKHLSA